MLTFPTKCPSPTKAVHSTHSYYCQKKVFLVFRKNLFPCNLNPLGSYLVELQKTNSLYLLCDIWRWLSFSFSVFSSPGKACPAPSAVSHRALFPEVLPSWSSSSVHVLVLLTLIVSRPVHRIPNVIWPKQNRVVLLLLLIWTLYFCWRNWILHQQKVQMKGSSI